MDGRVGELACEEWPEGRGPVGWRWSRRGTGCGREEAVLILVMLEEVASGESIEIRCVCCFTSLVFSFHLFRHSVREGDESVGNVGT